MLELGAWGDAARWEEYDRREQDLANDDSPGEPEYALSEEEDESGDGSVTNFEETAADQERRSSDADPNGLDYSTGGSSPSRGRPTEGDGEVEGRIIAHTPPIGSETERKIPYDWMVKRRGAQGSGSGSGSLGNNSSSRGRSSGTSP